MYRTKLLRFLIFVGVLALMIAGPALSIAQDDTLELWTFVNTHARWFQEQARESLPSLLPKLAFMGEDGEKFGVWPGTHEHCWTNGCLSV